MKSFLLGLDLIGFTGLCTSAALVSVASSLLRLTVKHSLALGEKILRFSRIILSRMPATINRTQKGNTNWLVLKVWKFSVLFGMKGE